MTHTQRDIFFVTISVLAAIFIYESGLLATLFSYTKEAVFLGGLVSGFLFTSVLTIPLSIAAILEVSSHASPWMVALSGGMGALAGDLLLFSFFNGHVANDMALLTKSHKYDRLKKVFHLKIFRWVIPLVGALIIASPLPDELGLAMMGVAKTRLGVFIPISFSMNTLGIFLIALAAVPV